MVKVATKWAICVVIALVQYSFVDTVLAQESLTRAIEGLVLFMPREQRSDFIIETNSENCTDEKQTCSKQTRWRLVRFEFLLCATSANLCVSGVTSSENTFTAETQRFAEVAQRVETKPVRAHWVVLNQPVQQNSQPQPALSASELANQINNPAAPVRFVQFRNILFPNIPGSDGVTNSFQIQPVIPIHKSKKIPFLQLIKMTLPISSAPSPISKKGLGDLQFFDLVSIKQKWGRWGFGPALVFPTATSKALGAGKWQAGPSFAAIYTGIENFTIGAVLQNPISFAGDSSRPAVNNLIITPTFTYNVPGYLFPGYWKHGWFLGLSDYNITFDWRNGGAATIPLGPQVGRVFHIGGQPFSASIEAGGLVKRPPNTPNPGLVIGFEFSVIFKGHRKDQ